VVTIVDSAFRIFVGAEQTISLAVMSRQIIQHLPPNIITIIITIIIIIIIVTIFPLLLRAF